MYTQSQKQNIHELMQPKIEYECTLEVELAIRRIGVHVPFTCMYIITLHAYQIGAFHVGDFL